ncbi:hypothetical protein AHAS_Ahas14G0005000 [Arachis hypogaea]
MTAWLERRWRGQRGSVGKGNKEAEADAIEEDKEEGDKGKAVETKAEKDEAAEKGREGLVTVREGGREEGRGRKKMDVKW